MSALPAIVEARDSQQDLLPEITRQKIMDYLTAFGLANELSEAEKNQFIEIACEYRLNPFKREIHCVPFNGADGKRLSIIVGYEVYIKRAERSGRLDGWRAYVEGAGEDMKAVVEIYRKDWTHPFNHQCYWREAAQRKRDGSLMPFWVKQPRFQLKKVAISQAFRMCFPDELGGIPYDASELPIDQPDPAQVQSPTIAHDSFKNDHPIDPEPETNSSPKVIGIPPVPQTVGQTVTHQEPTIREGGFVPFNMANSNQMDAPALKRRIEALLDQYPEVFNAKHCDWVLDKADAAAGLEDLRRLVGYLEKTIRQSRTATPAI